MVYLDSSAFLARVFGEPRKPAAALWRQRLVASRLLAWETWVRVHVRQRPLEVIAGVRRVLSSITLTDWAAKMPERALTPFPVAVRALDALHLATARHLAARCPDLRLATCGRRMADAAAAPGIPLVALE